MAPGKSNKSAASQQQNQRLKIVVRRLPPDLPEHVFWKSVSPWITRETAVQDTAEAGSSTDLPSQAEAVSWSKFKPGKIRKHNKDKDDIHSRAYILFKSPDALVAFHRAYDGWNFRDKTGRISQAVVEFAPYQRVPTKPSKSDPRQGTIDQDADFLAFQESLSAPAAAEVVPEQIKIEPRSTPLLEHLRAQKQAEKAAKRAGGKAGSGNNSKIGGAAGIATAVGAGGGGSSKKGAGKGESGKRKRGKKGEGAVAEVPVTGESQAEIAGDKGQKSGKAGKSKDKDRGKGKGKSKNSAKNSKAGSGTITPAEPLPQLASTSTNASAPLVNAQAEAIRQRLQQRHQQQHQQSAPASGSNPAGAGGPRLAGRSPTATIANTATSPQIQLLRKPTEGAPNPFAGAMAAQGQGQGQVGGPSTQPQPLPQPQSRKGGQAASGGKKDATSTGQSKPGPPVATSSPTTTTTTTTTTQAGSRTGDDQNSNGARRGKRGPSARGGRAGASAGASVGAGAGDSGSSSALGAGVARDTDSSAQRPQAAGTGARSTGPNLASGRGGRRGRGGAGGHSTASTPATAAPPPPGLIG